MSEYILCLQVFSKFIAMIFLEINAKEDTSAHTLRMGSELNSLICLQVDFYANDTPTSVGRCVSHGLYQLFSDLLWEMICQNYLHVMKVNGN